MEGLIRVMDHNSGSTAYSDSSNYSRYDFGGYRTTVTFTATRLIFIKS